MASQMTLEEARIVLEKLGYKKAGKFTIKQAQEKIDEVLESPDDFEGDARKVKEKEVKKLIDTIWDAVDDEDEIEVVEEEEEEEEDDEDEEEASDDDDEDEEEDDEDEEDEPVKKKGKKGKAAKAESNGKAKKGAKRQPPQRSVERDDFNRSINSGSHVINVVLERAKGPMTLAEITKTAKVVGKELGIKPRPTINRYLQRMIRLEQLEAEGRGEDRTFVLADGKPKTKKKVSKTTKDDDADETPRKKTGKKKAKAGKK